jgi:hypothetical protein
MPNAPFGYVRFAGRSAGVFGGRFRRSTAASVDRAATAAARRALKLGFLSAIKPVPADLPGATVGGEHPLASHQA